MVAYLAHKTQVWLAILTVVGTIISGVIGLWINYNNANYAVLRSDVENVKTGLVKEAEARTTADTVTAIQGAKLEEAVNTIKKDNSEIKADIKSILRVLDR